MHRSPVAQLPLVSSLRVARSFTSNPAVEYTLSADGKVSLDVYSMAGRRIAAMRDPQARAGTHTAAWRGLDPSGHVASGAYYVVLHVQSDGEDFTARDKLFVTRGR